MKICIFLNGTFENQDFYKKAAVESFDKVIVADGAANICYKMKITPDYIIGDFDSIEQAVKEHFEKQEKTTVIEAPSQDTLDFQEAIWLAEALLNNEDPIEGLRKREDSFLQSFANGKSAPNKVEGEHEITIFGGISANEIDHTVGNFFLGVSNVAKNILLKFSNEKYNIFVTKKEVQLDTKPNDLISIIPLTKVTNLTYQGLKYSIKNLDVEPGWLGTRNRTTSADCRISFDSGTLLIVKYN